MSKHPDPSNPDGKCHLLRIAPELRLNVYGCFRKDPLPTAWFELTPECIHDRYATLDSDHFPCDEFPTALFRTCRLISKEALAFLYDALVVDISVRSQHQKAARAVRNSPSWLYARSWVNIEDLGLWNNLRHLTLEFNIYKRGDCLEPTRSLLQVMDKVEMQPTLRLCFSFMVRMKITGCERLWHELSQIVWRGNIEAAVAPMRYQPLNISDKAYDGHHEMLRRLGGCVSPLNDYEQKQY
jgi:hypothetical protein